MHILLLNPFHTGSHLQWAEGYQRHSQQQVTVLSLPGRHWKWRMHGAAVELARQFMETALQPDVILTTDMLDLSTFLGLTSCAYRRHSSRSIFPRKPNHLPLVAERSGCGLATQQSVWLYQLHICAGGGSGVFQFGIPHAIFFGIASWFFEAIPRFSRS